MKTPPAQPAAGASAEAPAPAQWKRPKDNRVFLWTIAVLIALPLLVFCRTAGYGFIMQWDDDRNVTSNPLYQPAPFAHLADIWSKPYYGAYIPVTRTLWALLAGEEMGPAGAPATTFPPANYHIANLVVHIANTLLVFLLLRLLLSLLLTQRLNEDFLLSRRGEEGNATVPPPVIGGRMPEAGGGPEGTFRDQGSFRPEAQEGGLGGCPRAGGVGLGPAALGALVFAVHPLQVEPVAWVTGMKDLLCAFFSLLAVHCYLQTTRKEAPARWLIAASACYALALLSKSSAAILPVIVLFLDYLASARVPRQRLLLLGLWLVAGIAISLITKQAEVVGENPAPSPVALWQRPFVAGDTLTFYLVKVFVPYPLGPDYSRTPAWVMRHAWAYLPILVPICLVALAWTCRRKAPWLCAGIGLFILSLLPVSGIVPFDFQIFSTVADRYAYFALLGPVLVLAGALSCLPGRAALTVGGIVVTCFAVISIRQVPAWANTTTLFNQGLRANPNSAVSHWVLGSAQYNAGHFDAAVDHLRQAARLDPGYWLIQYDLGEALAHKWGVDGRPQSEAPLVQEAEQHLAAAAALNPACQPDERQFEEFFKKGASPHAR